VLFSSCYSWGQSYFSAVFIKNKIVTARKPLLLGIKRQSGLNVLASRHLLVFQVNGYASA
jgi:hypothetical protein